MVNFIRSGSGVPKAFFCKGFLVFRVLHVQSWQAKRKKVKSMKLTRKVNKNIFISKRNEVTSKGVCEYPPPPPPVELNN